MKKSGILAMLVDALFLVLSTFFFLYVNPSENNRPRLIYIGLQVCIMLVCVITSRVILGVYRHNFRDNQIRFSRINLCIVAADAASFVVIYLIQLVIPSGPIRIKFVQDACIVGLNLMMAITSRTLCQSVYEYAEEYADRSDRY